ncbi:hypothetical protein LEM8419_03536 [Neolewinella maritima]|uniref:SHOCT domain-containing protein n=1 Tax=Neolewinella maritima TaxID=1383882 RepID=A0ABN8F6V1_9BACT|nr:hypothetical protein [Neolewinella maritima]CAH1002664.1 hypothetical protein LEM8419_03536 [Neolewinella maritima]
MLGNVHDAFPGADKLEKHFERKRIKRLRRLAEKLKRGKITQAEYDVEVEDLDNAKDN